MIYSYLGLIELVNKIRNLNRYERKLLEKIQKIRPNTHLFNNLMRDRKIQINFEEKLKIDFLTLRFITKVFKNFCFRIR